MVSSTHSPQGWISVYIGPILMVIVFEGLEHLSKKPKAKATSRKRAPKTKVSITDKAREIKMIANLSWPMGEDKYELEFYQINFDYCDQLDKRLFKLRDRLSSIADGHLIKARNATSKASKEAHLRLLSKPRRQAEILHYITGTMPAPIHLAIWWAEEVNRMAHHWPGWRGKLLDFTLNDYNESLDKRFFSLTYACCMDGSMWPPIRKKLRATKLEE